MTAAKPPNGPLSVLKALVRGLGGIAPSCKEVARLQSEALDESLPLLTRLGLRFHLLLCKWCRRYGKQIAFLRAAAREHSHDIASAPADRLSEASRERIKRMLQTGEE